MVAISTGHYHTVGLKSDGTVVAVGRNAHETCNASEWKDIVAITAGYTITLGLRSDGSLARTGEAAHMLAGWDHIKLP